MKEVKDEKKEQHIDWKTFPVDDLGLNWSSVQNENKYLQTSVLSLTLSSKNGIVDLSGHRLYCDE